MKKILAFVVVMLSVFFLVSCDMANDNKDDKREQIEMTSEEMQAVMNDVNLAAFMDDVIVMSTEIKVNINAQIMPFEAEEAVEVGVEVNGKLDVYVNLNEFEDTYVYVNLDLNYEIAGDYETFMPTFLDEDFVAENPEYADSYEEYLQNKMLFERFKKVSVKAQAYLIEGVLYVNVVGSYAGTEHSYKRYETLYTSLEFAVYKAALEASLEEGEGFPSETMPDLDITVIPEHFNLIPYKINEDTYEFEYRVDGSLEDLIGGALGWFEDEETINVDELIEVTENTKFEHYILLRVSDTIDKLVIYSNTNLEVKLTPDVETDLEEVLLSIEALFNFELDFHGKMPGNLPTKGDFGDYAEGFDDIFEELLG